MSNQHCRTLILLSVIILAGMLSACSPGDSTVQPRSEAASGNSSGKKILAVEIADLLMILSNPRGSFSEGENEFTVEFQGAGGKPVEVGAITMSIEMPAMGSMSHMKNDVKLTTTNTPGIYHATAHLEMAGTWQMHVQYKGQAGEGRADFSITAK